MNEYKILSTIKSPDDVKALPFDLLNPLCDEIRNKLIETVSSNGGHLASNLGTVELTVALHRCFNSPEDSIVWDVGHQSYTHKLLTGRFENFDTLRKKNGVSGFTRPDESVYDLFYSGHAGVAVSQAAGIAQANKIKGNKNKAIAVIGDGSFTSGMVYEALNNAGASKSNLIVVLNDNEMSISENVGALAHTLAQVRAKPEYYRFKAGTEKMLNHIPVVGSSLSAHLFKLKTAIKNILYSSSFFEDFGFRYVGPVDGHNIKQLCDSLETAKLIDIPVLLHINTVKGKGYEFAENAPEFYHGVSSFDAQKGGISSSDDSFSATFGKFLCAFAKKDKRICAVTAAMSIGTGLEGFAKEIPDRFFDVGIAEEHALTFCSGLAAAGMVPVFAVYSSFFQRCFDQLMHDAALQRRKMIISVDRAGFVGSDGETHQGLYDISMMSGVPGITVYSPSTYEETGHALYNALYKDEGVVIIRYPKGGQPLLPADLRSSGNDFDVFGPVNCGNIIVTYGRCFANVLSAASKFGLSVIKLNKIKPLNMEILKFVLDVDRVFFVEESVSSGSTGEHFAAFLLKNGYRGKYYHKAVDDCFVMHASVDEQIKQFGLDSDSIENYIFNILKGERQ